MNRLGILGGTFDPIHYAHLFIAEEARVRFALDQVLFIPNGLSPFKTNEAVTTAEHRLEMVRLAVQSNSAFAVSRIEVDRPGPSYTVDTLRKLKEAHPDAELTFITGADAVADLEQWRDPGEVLRLARIIAVSRPGFPFSEVTSRLGEQTRQRIDLLQTAEIWLSATELRMRVQAGLSIRYLTPDAVAEYIARHNLYRDVEGT
jgi:nicotinate-nucleotide adenylyltransferase